MDDADSEENDGQPSTAVQKGNRRYINVVLLRNNKNLVEPRTSQGTFGSNAGVFVCFFRTPPRIVRNILRGLAGSAVRRLALSATDRRAKPYDVRTLEDRKGGPTSCAS